MKRQIIKIDEEKCNGCGICAEACHEGAIKIIDGKAKLTREDYCDGLGDCLPGCPVGAISFETREAPEYNAEAVALSKGGCPGSAVMSFKPAETAKTVASETQSQLMQWPVQIKLAPVKAPYFDGAKLLVAADCSAFSRADFHERFIRNHITLIGCPKLDAVDYSEKLSEIIRNNDIKELTVVRMEVPCCGGIENAAKTALKNSGKFIPWQVVTLSTKGEILD